MIFDRIILLQCSVDNDTFLETMNVGSSFVEHHYQQEEEEQQVHQQAYQVDEHGEGLIEPLKGRAGNYTVDEDRLLCKTWFSSVPLVPHGSNKRYLLGEDEGLLLMQTTQVDMSELTVLFGPVGPSSMTIVKSGRPSKLTLT